MNDNLFYHEEQIQAVLSPDHTGCDLPTSYRV